MVTVPTPETPPPYGSKLESLTHIDITKLSQSELRALSLCSDSTFDLRRTDDVVIPQIDRSFNESAGSLRQTYSRHLHSSSVVAGHRFRIPGLLPNHRTLPNLSPDDPELSENKSIVNFLKQFITGGKAEAPRPPQLDASRDDMQMVLCSREKKRKRETKPKPVVPISNIPLEIVNKNGVVVDLKALENADELYAAELRRRSVGLDNDEGLLIFLGNLEGQWGSRRKKRRFVDACEFGDWLPIGWKLLLGLKRKDSRVSVYCRRFMSPNGQQFTSCKESSSFLQSYFRLNDANQQLDGTGDNNQQACVVTSENCAGVLHMNGCIRQDSFPNSTVPNTSIPHVKEMEFDLIGIENLPDVQVRDLFECYKCNLTFDEKHPYLKHLMSFHQRTTRRYRPGSSIGEGAIIKEDEKYECQICRKVFQERRSYNGHVGVHVRNREETVLKRNESPFLDKLPPRISKMDALVEIAQSSILENSSAELIDKASGGSSPRRLKVATIPEHPAVNSDYELASDPNELDLENCMTMSIADQGCNQNYVQCITNDEEMVNSIDVSRAENNAMAVCTTFEHSTESEVEKHGNSEREIGLNSQLTQSHDVVTWSSGQTDKENVPQSGISDSSMTMMQPLDCFLSSTSFSNKGEHELCTVYQKLNSAADFDELRLEEMERLRFSFMNRQESPPLPGVSMNVADDDDDAVEEVFNSSFRRESESVVLNIDGRCQFTTTCVWCRTEFNHEAFESETQSDSVGFMCPSCKAKISGQLNVLDGGLSMNYRL